MIKKHNFFTFILIASLLINNFIFATPVTIQKDEPSIVAESAILIDAKTGNILFQKNADKKQYPASITKLMTSLLVIENLSPSDIISFSKDAIYGIERGSSHIGMDVGEQITVDQALHGLLLMSANEVANGLAEKVGGSIESFADLMTNRAKELGAKNTHFVNPHGLHNDNHYTTAYDMAMITRGIYNNKYFLQIMKDVIYQIPPTNKTTEIRHLSQQHKLLNPHRDSSLYRPDVIGGKTGYTDIAKNTLVTIARKGDVDLIAVVLKGESSSFYQDTSKLLDYGFNSYKSITLNHQTDVVKSLPVYSVKSGKLYEVGTGRIGVAKEKNLLLNKLIKERDIKTNIDLPDYLEMGVKIGDTLGSIQYLSNGKILAESELVLSKIDFEASPYNASLPIENRALQKANYYLIVLCILIFIIACFLFIRTKRKKALTKKLRFTKTNK